MSPSISVISIAHDHHTLRDHVQALDEQTLPYGDFEIVFSYDPRAPVASRLVRLAAHRPHVRLVPDDHHIGPAVLEAATAPIVLPLSTATRLRPTALRDVVDAAAGADVVIGGAPTVTTTWQLPGTDLLDAAGLDDVPTITAYRRDLLSSIVDSGPVAWPWSADVHRHAIAGRKVRVLPDPVTREDTDVHPVTADLDVANGEAAWTDAGLSASATLAPAGLEVVYVVATETDGDRMIAPAVADEGRYRAVLAVPGPGTWRLSWVAVVDDAVRSAPVRLEGLPPAVIDGRVVTRVPGTEAELDVDRPRLSLIALGDSATASVVEGAVGSLLTVPLAGAVASFGAERVSGKLGLGSMPVPATLVADDDGVRMEAYVSGLSGSAALSERFGTGRAVGTGLELAIDNLGGMTVRPAKPSKKPSKPENRPVGPAPAATPANGAPAVQKLRRALPEPVVAALERVPGVRAVYGTFVRR